MILSRLIEWLDADFKSEAAHIVGDLYLGDISVPPELHARMGITVPLLFTESDLIKVTL